MMGCEARDTQRLGHCRDSETDDVAWATAVGSREG